eukprot:1086210_1
MDELRKKKQLLNLSPQTAKYIINQQLDAIIEVVNQRRKLLLETIDAKTEHKPQILLTQQNHSISDENYSISVDIENDVEDIVNAVQSLGNIDGECDYNVERTYQGFQYESLLCSGFIRSNSTTCMRQVFQTIAIPCV